MARVKKDPFGRQLMASAPSAEDIEVRVSYLNVAGEELTEIREFILSTQSYGRGLTVPTSTFVALFDAVAELGQA